MLLLTVAQLFNYLFSKFYEQVDIVRGEVVGIIENLNWKKDQA